MLKIRKLFLMLIGLVALSCMFVTPMSDTFAKGAKPGSPEEACTVDKRMTVGPATDGPCQELVDITAFDLEDTINLIKLQRFEPFSEVHVYVIEMGPDNYDMDCYAYPGGQPIGPNLAILPGVNDDPDPAAPFPTRLGDPIVLMVDGQGSMRCQDDADETLLWEPTDILDTDTSQLERSNNLGVPAIGNYRIVADNVGWTLNPDPDPVSEDPYWIQGPPDGRYNRGDAVCFINAEPCFSILDLDEDPVMVSVVDASGTSSDYDVTATVANCDPDNQADVTVRMETLDSATPTPNVVDGPFDIAVTIDPKDAEADGCMEVDVRFDGPMNLSAPPVGALQTRITIVGSTVPTSTMTVPLDAEAASGVEE